MTKTFQLVLAAALLVFPAAGAVHGGGHLGDAALKGSYAATFRSHDGSMGGAGVCAFDGAGNHTCEMVLNIPHSDGGGARLIVEQVMTEGTYSLDGKGLGSGMDQAVSPDTHTTEADGFTILVLGTDGEAGVATDLLIHNHTAIAGTEELLELKLHRIGD